MNAPPEILAESASFWYIADRPVFDSLELRIASGEAVAICGPSGSGKSTLLKLMAGSLIPRKGAVELKLIDRRYSGPIGLVTQTYTNFDWLTVGDNLRWGAVAGGTPAHELDHVVSEALTWLRLVEHENDYPTRLSGGQRQRVAVGRALTARPGVLLLDEPFSALDPLMRVWLANTLFIDRPRDSTLVMVTHDVDEALRLADRVLVLSWQGHGPRLSDISLLPIGPAGGRNPAELEEIRTRILKMMSRGGIDGE